MKLADVSVSLPDGDYDVDGTDMKATLTGKVVSIFLGAGRLPLTVATAAARRKTSTKATRSQLQQIAAEMREGFLE